MKYLGTSLGKCVRSILRGEVAEEDVLLIVTGTQSSTLESFLEIVSEYYSGGNMWTSDSSAYDLTVKPLDEVLELAQRLYEGGKIHQPRNFSGMALLRSSPAWLEVAPSNYNSTPAVVEAYEKYKLLDKLTRD